MYGMTDTKCLRKWVKQYQEHGEKYFDKIKPKDFLVKTPKKLEEENLYLKAENEY
jgi:transposase-like protein